MFGRVKKDRDLVETWDDLINLLVGVGDARALEGGGVCITVPFKREKRSADVHIRCGDVSGLGQVAYVTSRVCEATPENVDRLVGHTSFLLEGSIVVEGDDVVLRATRPIEGMFYPDMSYLYKRIAATADELAKEYEASAKM